MKSHRLGELHRLIAKYGTADGKPRKELPLVTIARFETPTELQRFIAGPMFSLVSQGEKRVGLDKQIFDYGGGEYIITSVDLPISAQVTKASRKAPMLGVGVTLNPKAIADLLLEIGSAETARTNTPAGIGICTLTEDLIDAVIRFIRLLDKPSDIPVLGPSIEREILWRLLGGPQGAQVRQLGSADSHTFQISNAIRWIRSNYAKSLRIEALARIAGMSVTSFHRHFRDITSMTPIQYQKHMRLQEARIRLMSTADDVTAVGLSVGYDSPSQFSREYRRLFGAPPGRDSEWMRHSNTSPVA